MPSIWEHQSFLSPTDFCIVGAGLTGIFTALAIRRKYPHASIRILERGMMPSGASVKNAGFACFGSPSEIIDDAAIDGMDQAILRVARRYRGLKLLKETLGEPDDWWQDNGGYEVFTEGEKTVQEECLARLKEINDLVSAVTGIAPYSYLDEEFGMNMRRGAVAIAGEASLHPGRMLLKLTELARSKGIAFSFGVKVNRYDHLNSHIATETDQGTFLCERLVLCTNAFTRALADLPVWPNRGQILLTEAIPGLKLKGNYHLHQGYYYFRDFEGGILLGGGRHLDRANEQTDSTDTSPLIQQALEQLLRDTIIPNTEFRIRMRWSGTMAFGANNEKEPLIREIEPGVFAAVRLGGMGVAMAPNVAEELVQLL